MPKVFGKGSYASICTSIDAAAHEADSGNNDNDGDEHSVFGELAGWLTLIPRIYLQGI
jgi:hypothetical protein